jgi:hypothetical protein
MRRLIFASDAQGRIEQSAPTGFPEHQGSEAPQAELNVEEAQDITASKNLIEEKENEAADKFTGTAPEAGKLDVAKSGSAKEAKRTLPLSLTLQEM